ncbi:GDSL-type esterase/lipase family protein [Pedobacter sp. MC2016-14]|uniref:SGNH/GDSL hydrolase family protein n=1 Tax=Pedobacter sp. MC2016-14 TaxID=2897327 RepID=UPI001E63D819|nr:GDSL-type esterase/lipase family protein [Pedobacter sp. MC2016-14]MCD0487023.1 GDSL-type esterase/lipase family protein [Pedobacter sp. MC2016-14]
MELELPEPLSEPVHSYLALGDSYTIGEAVDQELSFPYQLATVLKTNGIRVAEPRVIAKTGWTTDELKVAVSEAQISGNYSFVTLLIGVNNQYRGYSPDVYRKEFKELLSAAIGFAGGHTNRVFVVSIPDWGATSFGKESGKDVHLIAEEIDQFNAINKEETLSAGVHYTDITPASRLAATDAALTAIDGLHPSGKMYSNWVDALVGPVAKLLK